MNYKLAIYAFLSIFLCACVAPTKPFVISVDKHQSSLAEASYAVSRSMVDLAVTAQAAHPVPNLGPPISPASYGMGALATLDWSGPVEPLIRDVARAVNYRVRVLGTPPAIPIIVTIYVKNAMLGDILRDIGYQCGRRATVVVYPEARCIELRYAKN